MLTISQREEMLTAFLREAGKASEKFRFFVPEGFMPVVSLRDTNGRKKRSTADERHWTPEAGQIWIEFEAVRSGRVRKPLVRSSEPPPPKVIEPPAKIQTTPPAASSSLDDAVEELMWEFRKAEQLGRKFIGLRWFREEYLLPTLHWYEHRKDIISEAIERGKLQVERIENPQNPEFPTAALRAATPRKVKAAMGSNHTGN